MRALVKENGKTLKYVFHIVVSLFLIFGLQFFPPLFGLNQMGMSITGIFLGTLYLWIVLGNFIWPSLLAILALAACEYDSMNNIFASSFGNNLIPFLIFIFIYVAFLENAGVCTRISNWFLSRTCVAGHPWILIIFICLSAYVMAMCTYCYPACLISWSITYSICEEVGYEKGDKFPALLVLAISVSSFCGYAALPTKAVALLAIELVKVSTNGNCIISFSQYAACMIPMTMISMFLVIGIICFVFKADPNKLKLINNERFIKEAKKPMAIEEKIAFISIVIFIALMCLPTFIPQKYILSNLLSIWGMNGPLFLVLILLSVFSIKGKPVVNIAKLARKANIDWNVILMTTACCALSSAVGNKDVGVLENIYNAFTPILENLPVIAFIIIAFIVVAVSAQILNQLVVTSVMIPIIIQISLTININHNVFAVLIIYAVSIALITPAASAMAALVHSNDWILGNLCYKVFGAHFIVTSVVLLLVFLPIIYCF